MHVWLATLSSGIHVTLLEVTRELLLAYPEKLVDLGQEARG